MDSISDHAGLLTALGGGAVVGEYLQEKAGTVRAMISRNRIPPEYWPKIIELGRKKEIDVTAEWLMRTTPARKRGDTHESASTPTVADIPFGGSTDSREMAAA